MTPDTQFVLMVKKLAMDPKSLLGKNGAWYGLMKLENLTNVTDGKFRHGPAFTVILKGKAAEPQMPIFTARKGCVVMVVGRLSSIRTKKGISTVIESGWVNVILHPGAYRHMKFRQTPSAPPMNTPIDLSEIESMNPDSSVEALDSHIEAMGLVSMDSEKEFTEKMLTEILCQRFINEAIEARSDKAKRTPKPKRERRRTVFEGEEQGLVGL